MRSHSESLPLSYLPSSIDGLFESLTGVSFYCLFLLSLSFFRRIPVYNYTGALPNEHFRRAPYLFHRMGFMKAELIAQVWQREGGREREGEREGGRV